MRMMVKIMMRMMTMTISKKLLGTPEVTNDSDIDGLGHDDDDEDGHGHYHYHDDKEDFDDFDNFFMCDDTEKW